MLLPATPQFRRKRGGPKKVSTNAPPGPTLLTLISAFYTPDGGAGDALLTLQFSRPIDAAGFIVEAFLIKDAQFNMQYYLPGGGWGMVDPQTVEFTLNPTEPASGSGVHLTASEGNGIVAVDNAEPWPGVTDLLLPFP